MSFKFLSRWIGHLVANPTPPNVIIAICGKKGVGKDTTTKIIRQIMWRSEGHYYEHRAFAKPLKDIVQTLTLCSPTTLETHEGKESVCENPFSEQKETYRDILKRVGKAIRVDLANWIDQMWKRDTQQSRAWGLANMWILSDLRLSDELKWVRAQNSQETKTFVVHVTSGDREDKKDRDVSETSVEMFPENEIDFTIRNIHWNDNQQNLEQQCQYICNAILYRMQ